MQTRSRARDIPGMETTHEVQPNGVEPNPPREQSPPRGAVPHEQAALNGEVPHLASSLHPPPAREHPPQSGRASSGPIYSKSPHQPAPSFPLPKSRIILGSRGGGTQAGRGEQQDISLGGCTRTEPPRIEATLHPPLSAQVEDLYMPLAVAPPRHSPFAPAILVEALPVGVKVSNLSEYNGMGDPQEHLDKFYAKIDWYDLSDAAYCKVFRTMLSKRALAWFNQLPAGTISSLEQLTQHFLHHFSMNKRVPKTAAFLFIIRQKENEPLRDYVQRFVEAVHEVPHVNHELLASIMQQNLLPGRFKESIARKPPPLWRTCCGSQKYIRIEESNASDPSIAVKRKSREEEKEPKKKEERKHVPPMVSHTTLP
ncbi:UNVERIFIED_CONTAM: hypothetical protein Slati_1458300 [Sesamum latifolium]|uniref:Retrotransposon gag domain-containing protein n=1 Tax=Sesamum latifolium TaxID=2727402 RepID=A0AAW2X577_9LAMI